MRREISRNAKSRDRKREISRRGEALAGGEFDRHRPDLRAQGRGLDAEQPPRAAGAGNLPVAGLERAADVVALLVAHLVGGQDRGRCPLWKGHHDRTTPGI